MNNAGFYKGKKVFVTGHTGFKGSWLCRTLLTLGADITGFALEPSGNQILYMSSGMETNIRNIYGDIRNSDLLEREMKMCNPEIIIHMAAQPLVRESYRNPVETYSVNVMGTVHFLESARKCNHVRSVINVTTDKVYLNKEENRPFIEEDKLNGYDPYSNSKSCSELVTSAYKNSFFTDNEVAVSTCRAGNVIGGGDFAKDRIIPDCYRAVSQNNQIIVRNPDSVRPYQHVMEPVYAYLLLAKMQYENKDYQGEYNIGPDESSNINTGKLVSLFCQKWGEGAVWTSLEDKNAVHEASLLYLDCSKAESLLKWKQIWDIETTLDKTVEWYKEYQKKGEAGACMENQVQEFLKEADVHEL